MKLLIGSDIGGYTFDASAKTITLSGIATLSLEQILLITNVTTQKIIYQFNHTTLGGSILNNVITLTYDTTLMSDTDKLQIFIEYPVGHIKSNDLLNPFTFQPRGQVITSHTKDISGTNYNFVGNYPKTLAGGGLGSINPIDNSRDTLKSGILIKPPTNSVIYLKNINIFVEYLNSNDVLQRFDSAASLVITNNTAPLHSPIYLNDIILLSGVEANKIESLFTKNLTTWIATIPFAVPYRLTATSNDYIQIKMSGDIAPNNTNITAMYFSFNLWITTESEEI
jgi:hypothetical protein